MAKKAPKKLKPKQAPQLGMTAPHTAAQKKATAKKLVDSGMAARTSAYFPELGTQYQIADSYAEYAGRSRATTKDKAAKPSKKLKTPQSGRDVPLPKSNF